MKRIIAVAVGWVLLLTAPAIAQEHSHDASKDSAVQEVRKAVEEAQKEISGFREGGGKNDDPKHPAVKWLGLLWEYRQKYPGTEAAGLATYEALHFLFHSGRADEVLSRVDALPPDDSAWERLPTVLNELATERKDPSVLTRRLEPLVERTASARVRANALLALGRAYRQANDRPRAEAALNRVLAEAPGSESARTAQNLLYELANLSVGQPAPPIGGQSRARKAVSLVDFKGQPVVVEFWATTCKVCMEEMPLVKEIYARNQPKGVQFVGVSMDTNPKQLDRVAKAQSVQWPQLADGNGFDGAIAKAYMVRATPAFFVLDRAGRIFARVNSAKELEREVTAALAMPVNAPARSARDVWQRPYDVMDKMGAAAGSRVADIGAGGGYFTSHLATRVGASGRVYAVDIDDAALTRLRERLAREGLTQVEPVRGEGNDPKLPADSLDAILTVDAYHEFREYDAMLQAFYRSLKPGGRLAIVDHSGLLAQPRATYHNRHNIPAELIVEDAARAGLRLRFFDPEFVREGAGTSGQYSYLLIFEKPKTN